MDINEIIMTIVKHQKTIAKERDQLADFIGELDDLKECCEQAWEDLDSAREKLSQYV